MAQGAGDRAGLLFVLGFGAWAFRFLSPPNFSHAVLWPLQASPYGLPAWATASAVRSRWQKEPSE